MALRALEKAMEGQQERAGRVRVVRLTLLRILDLQASKFPSGYLVNQQHNFFSCQNKFQVNFHIKIIFRSTKVGERDKSKHNLQ